MLIKLIGLNGRYTHSTLSLFYLRQALVHHGFQDIVLEQYTINDNYFETLARIAHGEPAVICLSVYIWNSNLAGRLLQDLPAILPRCQLIIGGPEASSLLKQQQPEAVTLVQGEVEGLPDSFFSALQRNELAPMYQAAPRPLFFSPYHDSDFAGPLAHRHVYYESSRGCPYRCAYCLSAASKDVRLLELEQIKDELTLINGHQVPIVRFIDRTFNIDPQRTLAIWEFLLSLDNIHCFHFEIAPDRFNRAMYDFLATVPAGRFQFEVGLQSTHKPALQAVNRSSDSQTSLAAIHKLSKLNTIHIHADLILGLPQETTESFAASLNHLLACTPHYIQMGLLKVLPGSPLADQAEQLGLTHRQQPPYELLSSPWFNYQQLCHYYWLGECVEKFYNCHFFKPLFSYLANEDVNGFSFFSALLELARQHDFFTRATTQELMSEILAKLCQQEADSQTRLEILQYCWLATGRKKMAQHLPAMDLKKLRDHYHARLAPDLEGLYDRRGRNRFFKQSVFAHFSKKTMQKLGYSGRGPGLIFHAKPEPHTIGKAVKVSEIDQQWLLAEQASSLGGIDGQQDRVPAS